MKRYLILILFSLILSCDDETQENYPIEPAIGLKSIAFNQGLTESPFDTLTFTIAFTDGDGDFGFEPGNEAHLKPPYQQAFFYLKSTGEPVPSDQALKPGMAFDELIRYDDRENPPYDTLPDNRSCYFYADEFGIESNPLYWTPNGNFNNLFVKFFYQDDSGTFVEFDWDREYCQNFNRRVYDVTGKRGPITLVKASDKKGELTYKMISIGWLPLLGENKMKLRIHIQDLALHRSNVVESEPFYLEDI